MIIGDLMHLGKSKLMFLIVIFSLSTCNKNSTIKKYESDNKITNEELCLSRFDSITNRTVYDISDELAFFSTEDEQGMKYIATNYSYPMKQEIPQYRIVFHFVVDTTGLVIGARIPNKISSEYTLAETKLLEVIENMPKWTPAFCAKKKVPMFFASQIFISPEN